MSTTPVMPESGTPEIPLTPEIRAAYEELYSHYEKAIENTADPTLHASLMKSQDAVGKIISLDNTAILERNSDAFAAVLEQINIANAGLSDLKKEIEKVAGHIAMYAGILSGINKVLSMIPGV